MHLDSWVIGRTSETGLFAENRHSGIDKSLSEDKSILLNGFWTSSKNSSAVMLVVSL